MMSIKLFCYLLLFLILLEIKNELNVYKCIKSFPQQINKLYKFMHRTVP